jgi:hypothetical protein
MQNMILATPVLSDAATITGSASSGDGDISNLKKMSLRKVYRVVSETAYINVDLLSAEEINLISLIGHNGVAAGVCRVRANSTNDFSGAVAYDSGNLPLRSNQLAYVDTGGALDKNLFLLYLAASQTYRYWQIDITNTGGAYLDIGRLYVSKAFQPATNMDYGIAEGYIDPSRKYRTVSGEVMSVERSKYRFCEFTLGYATKEDMFNEVFEIESARGRTRDVLFVPDPDEKEFLQKRSYYGNMEAIQPKVNINFGIYSKTFRIEEIAS